MRDEDMADVDVSGPGVWDRESDMYYHELCQREEEEERERDQSLHPNSSSGLSSSASCSRPRARGAKLTEANLKIWLSLVSPAYTSSLPQHSSILQNPREPASKHQTLNTYLNTQNDLLVAENKARLQAMQEARQLDNKMRDAYSELRRSAYDLGANSSALDDRGIRIRSPSGVGDDLRITHKRDTTLLENGMIVERVDMRKEEARIRKEERRVRKVSRDSLSVVENRDRERDAASLYSSYVGEGAASMRSIPFYDGTKSSGVGTNRSVRSMYTTPSLSWQPPVPNRPMSMAPGLASQTSLDSAASPRRRFLGLRQLSGYFGSSTTLGQSGSMIDMQYVIFSDSFMLELKLTNLGSLGLDQDKHFAQTPHVDIGSNAPSLREAWPRMEDGMRERTSSDRASSTHVKKKKRGLGRLWKIFTGVPNKPHVLPGMNGGPLREEEFEDFPLAPPPPLSYLVDRYPQSERSMNMMGQGRHVSMPSLTLSNGPHPRSNSTPSGVGVSLSSPSEKSSILPSPTEVRFPYRDSSGDEPEDGAYEEGAELAIKKKRSLSVNPRPVIFNVSEPEFFVSPSAPNPMLTLPLPQTTGTAHPSSPQTPTIKVPVVPPIRRMSILSLDKSLPPIPPGEHESPTSNPLPHHPRGPAVPSATLPVTYGHHHPGRELSPPNSGFRFEDAARRQSSDGLPNRPYLPRGAKKGTTPGMRFDDFGASRHSLAVLEPIPSPANQPKRRFGIATLLGRKEKPSGGHRQHASVTTRPISRTHEKSFDGFLSHMATPSLSERSLSQQGLGHTTRRQLDDLVPQDPDFVAYRYPSKDERLDLSRN